MKRTCDFCGLQSPAEPEIISDDGYLVFSPKDSPHVLRLKMEVDPGVRFNGGFDAKTVTYQVCTDCLFRFLLKQELDG